MVTNAVLMAVNGPGAVDRSGKRTGDAGELLWSGTLRCYLRRASRMETTNGNLNRVNFDQLVIHGRAPAQVNIGGDVAGYVVTVEDHRGDRTARKFRVDGVERLAVGSVADSIRLDLTEV